VRGRARQQQIEARAHVLEDAARAGHAVRHDGLRERVRGVRLELREE